MDINTLLTWFAIVAGISAAFIFGVYVGHRRYMAGYIDGYLDAMDDNNEIDKGDPGYVQA